MPAEHNLPFPFEHSLFIATPNALHLRSQARTELLFECDSSDSIVSARASTDNSDVLAIADSQIIILHSTTRRCERKYKLKGGYVSASIGLVPNST